MRPATFSSARAACAPRAPCVRRSPHTMTMSSPASRSRSATAPTSWAVEPAACASSSSTPPPPSAALRAATNASPAPGAKRATAPALGSSDEGRLDATASLTPLRRTPLRIRRSTIGMSSTGSQSRTRTACANSMSGIVACTDGLPSAACRPAGRRPEARESRCGESTPSRMRRWRRKPSSFVVPSPASAPTRPCMRPRAPAAASRARSQLTGASSPPSRSIGWVMRSSTWIDWYAKRPRSQSHPSSTSSWSRERTRRTRSSRTVSSTLHWPGQSAQTEPEPSMSHGRARKRYGCDVSAPTGQSSMMLPLNGAT